MTGVIAEPAPTEAQPRKREAWIHLVAVEVDAPLADRDERKRR